MLGFTPISATAIADDALITTAAVTGVAATGAVGTVSLVTDQNLDQVGLAATASVGSVSITAGTGVSTTVTGLTATGEITDEVNTFTGAGDAQLSTAQAQFGDSSLLLDGNGDYIRADNNVLWGDADFTVEFWFRGGDVETGSYFLFDNTIIGSDGIRITIASGFANLIIDGVAYGIGGSVTNNTWHNVAVVRDGNNYSMYLDGTNVGSRTVTAKDYSDRRFVLGAGQVSLGYNSFDGYIDEFRASSTARYTTGYTPATAAFTADQYTPILLHFDGTNGSTTFTNDGVASAVFVTTGTGVEVRPDGLSSTASEGEVTTSGTADVPTTGLSASAAVGTVTQKTSAVLPVPSFAVSGGVGSITAIGNATVTLTGVSSSGEVGTVLVWGRIVPDPNTVWTEIVAA